MEGDDKDYSSCKQIEQLKLYLNQLLDEKTSVANKLSKSEEENNVLINEIGAIRCTQQERIGEYDLKSNEDITSDFSFIMDNLLFLENMLTTDERAESCLIDQIGKDEQQGSGTDMELCNLKKDVKQMKHFLEHLRHYLEFAEKRKLHLVAVRNKLCKVFQKDSETKQALEEKTVPPLRRPKMELLRSRIDEAIWLKLKECESSSNICKSLEKSSSTMKVCRTKSTPMIPAVDNFSNSTPQTSEDLCLTDCQKLLQQQKTTIDELNAKIREQNIKILQFDRDVYQFHTFHEKLLQMQQHEKSLEMKIVGLEKQNDVYFIAIVKLMEQNDRLQLQISNSKSELEKKTVNFKTDSTETIDLALKPKLSVGPTSNVNIVEMCHSITLDQTDTKEIKANVEQDNILRKLTEKLKVFKDLIAHLNNQTASLEEENNQYKHQIELLKIEIDELSTNNVELVSQMETLKQSNDTLNTLNVDLSSELQKLQIESPKEIIDSLKKENLSLIKDREGVVAENNNLLKKYDNLRSCIASFKSSRRLNIRKVQTLRFKLLKMRRRIQKQGRRQCNLVEKYDKLQLLYSTLLTDHQSLNLQKDDFLVQVEELQKHKEKLISTLETLILEKQQLEDRLDKRNQTICACCLKLNRDYITLKGSIQHLHTQIAESQEEIIRLKQTNIEIQKSLVTSNERFRITNELLENEKQINNKLLSDQIEIKADLDKERFYLERKYKGTIDKLGKEKSTLKNDLNELEMKYRNLSELSEKENFHIQSKMVELIQKNTTLEETLEEASKNLKQKADMVLQLTNELEEQSIQLELFQQSNIMFKQQFESIYNDRTLVEQQLQKTVNNLKKSESRYLSVRKLLVDAQSYVAGDSENLKHPDERNCELFNLKMTLKNCQDELFDVKDKLTDSLTISKSLEEQIMSANMVVHENKQKLNRSIVILVTSWRTVLERVMNVQVILDQLAAVTWKSFAPLDETISQLQEQTSLTIKVLEALVSWDKKLKTLVYKQ